jgi:hypothetical protein
MFTGAGAETLDTDINANAASMARWQIFVYCVVGSVDTKLTMADVAKLVYGLQDAAHTNARKAKVYNYGEQYTGSAEHPIGNYHVSYTVWPTYHIINVQLRDDRSKSR